MVAMTQLCLDSAEVVGGSPVAAERGGGGGIARYGEGLVCDGVVVSLRKISLHHDI